MAAQHPRGRGGHTQHAKQELGFKLKQVFAPEITVAATLSTATGAALIGADPRLVQQEFRRVLGPVAAKPARTPRQLTFRELLYFQVVNWLNREGVQLSPSQKQQVYLTLTKGHHQTSSKWVRHNVQLIRQGVVPVSLNLAEASQSLRYRYRLLRHPERLVESNPATCAGQTVFRGTRIPLSVVVGQLQAGVPRRELETDFPQLNRAALDYAEIQARLPKPAGRPQQDLRLRRG